MSFGVENYEYLSSLTGQMREAAVQGDWDNLVELEKQCSQKVSTMEPEPTVQSDEEARKRKIALIKKILADDAEIRNRTEVWMEQLQRIMQSSRNESQLRRAYSVGQ
jgi:flagellar protein FliT